MIVARNGWNESGNEASGFWFEEHGLDLATEKTEIILFIRRRVPTIIPLQVGADTVLTQNVVK